MSGYTASSSYDEMWDSNGKVRPHWQPFMQAINELGGQALEECRKEARRHFRENGVSYNVHGDPHGQQRTLQLDPIPLIISSEDWSEIESGLLQRAELMNLIMSDLYGDRKLIQEGLLPAELLFGHMGYFRACDGFKKRAEMRLQDFAVDLARGPDGRMWVLRDYTQSPAGIGYALENRTVMTRILPQFFQDGNIHRMSFFFRTLRAGLAALPTKRKDNPRIVVLTPGPYNELYFEHAYLASYLGYPLVQGDDLTVRNGNVWLKTLDGLQPVEIIIRRLHDRFCDPLELDENSLLGVAGLLNAARMGNVVIVNPLGSGVLENPGLAPFLPGIARYYFESELKLPSAATWWCGQPNELNHVLSNFDSMVIKPINRVLSSGSIFCASLNRVEQSELKAKIQAEPHMFVGQEQVSFSTTPCLVNGKIEPRHAALRTFVTAQDKTYHVMKGGLTRAALHSGAVAPSRSFDNFSKDTWILATSPEPHVSLWLQPKNDEMTIERTGILASRAAENLYWTGRYAERLEGTARLLLTVTSRMSRSDELSDEDHRKHTRLLLQYLGTMTRTRDDFLGSPETTRQQTESEIHLLLVDEHRTGSVANLLSLLIQATNMVRDRWSQDNWRVLDRMKNHWRKVQKHSQMHYLSIEDNLDELTGWLAAFTGLNMESMTREPGWLMLDSGRRFERALWLIKMMKCMLLPEHGEKLEQMILESFLSTHESLITHRRRYRSYLQMQTVLDVILTDDTNPRSLAYQLERLQKHLARLPRQNRRKKMSDEEKLILEASTQLKLSDPLSLSRVTGREGVGPLSDLLTFIEDRLEKAAETLNEDYFSHAHGARQLMPTRKEPGNI